MTRLQSGETEETKEFFSHTLNSQNILASPNRLQSSDLNLKTNSNETKTDADHHHHHHHSVISPPEEISWEHIDLEKHNGVSWDDLDLRRFALIGSSIFLAEWLLAYPIDLAITRVTVDTTQQTMKFWTSTSNCLRSIYAQNGLFYLLYLLFIIYYLFY